MNWINLICWIALAAVLGFSVYLECCLIYYKEKFEWMVRHLRLLEALIKDYDQLEEKRARVESVARSLWDLEDLSGIHLQLSEAENEWVESTRGVVNEAKVCVAKYNKHSSGLCYGLFTAIFRSMSIIYVLRQIDVVTSTMSDHLKEKDEKAKGIYKSMERSRYHFRSWLGRNTIEEEEEEDKAVAAAQIQKQKKKPSINLKEFINKSKDQFSSMEERWCVYLLLPLQAFLKDLSQLQLETKTEDVWRSEAEEIIKHAEDCIRSYSWWISNFSIFKNNIPIRTRQFREDMKRIVTDFDELLTRKEKYNFAFIDRAAEKSTFQNIADDREIISAIQSINSKLEKQEKSSRQVADMKPLYNSLVKTYKQLQRAEETAGREACLVQLKYIAQEVDNFLESYMNRPKLKRLEITNAINLLHKIVKICFITRQESTKIAGLKNEVRDLVLKLTTSGDNPSTLSIVGMKGVGKTTLAKAVYYKKDVVEHFPVRVWVPVTEGAAYKAQVLLMKNDGTKDQTLFVTQIRDHLKEKLCLVVLDNVSKPEDFDKLNELLSGSGWTNGSRIMLTTRFKKVASHADRSSTPQQIRLLTKEESWALFLKVAGCERTKLEPKVEKFAKLVVGRCGGLPLAILSLGSAMLAKGITQKNLSWVLDRINQGQYKAHWQRVWETNKQELTETMKNCLYYFTHFPVDFEIPVRRLVNLWVAEGLAQANDQQTQEGAAERCLEELRDCNMIQAVALKSDVKIKTCRLPIMLREIILRDSDRTSRSQYSGTHLERRFAYHFDGRDLDANSATVFNKEEIPMSVFFFDKREGSKPGEQLGEILSRGIASEQFLEIKILDLEHVFRPQLPETLSKLSKIKYLNLRWTYLEEFPKCICQLIELEILDLKHTSIRVIPSSIWKLKNLKKLYLNQKYRSRIESKPSGNFQENLQALWGVFLYGSYPLLRHLHRLKNLQKLKLAFQLSGSEHNILAREIVQLKQLCSLRLRSVNEVGSPKKLTLNNMSSMENLSSLHLFGIIEDKIRMTRLPQDLTDLTLSASKLSDDPMPELQNLPKLKSLCFYADSYMGKKMGCATGSFLQLQVLRFWNLSNLEEWDVKEGAMPSLIEFESRSCKNLACPAGLKHLKTLCMIKLHRMSKTFVRDIFNRKKTLLNDVEIDHDRRTLTVDQTF